MKFEVDCFEDVYKYYTMIVEANDEKEARKKAERGDYLELKEVEENCDTSQMFVCEGEDCIREVKENETINNTDRLR